HGDAGVVVEDDERGLPDVAGLRGPAGRADVRDVAHQDPPRRSWATNLRAWSVASCSTPKSRHAAPSSLGTLLNSARMVSQSPFHLASTKPMALGAPPSSSFCITASGLTVRPVVRSTPSMPQNSPALSGRSPTQHAAAHAARAAKML